MKLNYNKENGLIPAIIQNSKTLQTLMLGYMNEAAYNQTVSEGRVTFFSRSKNRLWTKGETSGNYLIVEDIAIDCDQDALLIKASPMGPTCHRRTTSCFGEADAGNFIYQLEQTIAKRIVDKDESSYTHSLVQKGINKVAQKVGEEAVELIIEAKDDSIDVFNNEAADLLYHYIVLLQAKGSSLRDIEQILLNRHNAQ